MGLATAGLGFVPLDAPAPASRGDGRRTACGDRGGCGRGGAGMPGQCGASRARHRGGGLGERVLRGRGPAIRGYPGYFVQLRIAFSWTIWPNRDHS